MKSRTAHIPFIPNRDDWEKITQAIERDEVDLLLVSPERFNNPAFRADVLPTVAMVS